MESNQSKKEQFLKLNFFKKIWYSIDKIEKYGEMSAQGFPRAISYLFQIIIILALIVAGTTLYQTRNAINQVAQFVKDEIPNFTYSDNELKLENMTNDDIKITGKIENIELERTED